MTKRIYIAAVVIILGGLLGNILRFNTLMPDHPADFGIIPLEHDGYIGVERKLADLTYDVLKADVTTYRDYIFPNGSRLGLFIAYFESQKYGSQIHSPKNCLPGGGWRIESIRPYRLELSSGDAREVNLVVISTRDQRALMMYWFETRSGSIRNEYGLKLDLVKNSLLFRPTDAAIVRLTTDVTGTDINSAVRNVTQFLESYSPSIRQSLPF